MNYKAIIFDLEILNGESISTETIDALLNLKKKKIRLAIGSSGKNIRTLLKKSGIETLFDAVVDGERLINTGAHPERFLKACDLLGTRPIECLVVGDTVEGIDAAFRGGFDSAAIGEACEHEMATIKIDEIRDLAEGVFS